MSDRSGGTIRVTENGPLMVKGPVTLIDADGGVYEDLRKTYFLCRCGASRRKPFCDGSHTRIGFAASERVAQPMTEKLDEPTTSRLRE